MLTGGQDDLISIWSVVDSAIVARCQGHQSWVTSVAFDPWRCDDRNYRFGSVGEDCRLCLWDFNVGMLHRPKAVRCRLESGVEERQGHRKRENLTVEIGFRPSPGLRVLTVRQPPAATRNSEHFGKSNSVQLYAIWRRRGRRRQHRPPRRASRENRHAAPCLGRLRFDLSIDRDKRSWVADTVAIVQSSRYPPTLLA